MNGAELLLARGVRVRYGGVDALAGVDLTVEAGHIVGLIGPNGAGKTTLINALTGTVRPAAGHITLEGRRIDGLAPHRVARAGIARTYQNIRLFAALTVADNVRAGAFASRRTLLPTEIRTLLARAGVTEADTGRVAGALPYGEQRRLEIARALAANPKVLLLDEPAAGMNPHETKHLGDMIVTIAAQGVGVLLVEHDMSLINAVCNAVTVLNFGTVLAQGDPATVVRDAAVIEAYLGAPAQG